MGEGPVTGHRSKSRPELEAEAAARRADAGHRRQRLCRLPAGKALFLDSTGPPTTGARPEGAWLHDAQ